MSAWKPLVLPILIFGTIAGTLRADAISWPSGLDNWVVYLAAPSGNPGPGPLTYTSQQSVAPPSDAWPVANSQPVSVAPSQASPSPTPPAPTQIAPPAVAASSQSAIVQAVPNTPIASQAPPVQATIAAVQTTPAQPASSPAPVQAAVSAPLSPSYTPPAAPPSTPVQLPSYTPPSSSQSSMVQPITYIQPVSSPPSSAQPVASTPPSVVSNVSPSNNQLALTAPTLSTTPSTPAAVSSPVQAFINLGAGPYPLAAAITTGGAQPWYNSSQLTSLFGGQPTAQQIQSFDNVILQRVQQAFSQSGISVSLTDNPNVAALHTISLVSNTGSSSLASAIGMTQVGSNGFSFIDQIAPSAQSLNQLEWIVAHNISHELMLAFGVPENYDTTGNFIDSKMANWAMMVNPNATFSSAAAQAINQALASQSPAAAGSLLGAQEFNPSPAPIPEPTTVAIWGLAAAALVIARQRRPRRNSLARLV